MVMRMVVVRRRRVVRVTIGGMVRVRVRVAVRVAMGWQVLSLVMWRWWRRSGRTLWTLMAPMGVRRSSCRRGRKRTHRGRARHQG